MTGLKKFVASAIATLTFALIATAVPSPVQAQDSTWDLIKKRGVVLQGCVVQPPHWRKDTQGEWRGWGITAGNKLAEDLKVKVECVETTFGTAPLQIQAGKMDLMWAMQATPLRATAITFAGPLYNHGFMVINRKGFEAKNWEDYNKPDVKVSCQEASTSCVVRRLMAPKSIGMELKQELSTLAVASGRADAMIVSVLTGIYAKHGSADLGTFVIPQPLTSLPAYVGLRNETDRRFSDFMHWWAEWYRLQGEVERWIRDSLLEVGVKPENIPDKLYF